MTDLRTATRFTASARLTPANALTLARILLAPVLFVLIFEAEETRGASWPVFTLGVLLALTDHYDGQLARRHGTTRSGAFLDPLADKVVVIGAMVCLVMVDRYWWLPVAIVTAREVTITAMRAHFARNGMAIPARTSAKFVTACAKSDLSENRSPNRSFRNSLAAPNIALVDGGMLRAQAEPRRTAPHLPGDAVPTLNLHQPT